MSLVLSLVVCPVALYLAAGFPFDGYYEPLTAVLLVSLAASWLRLKGMRQHLPKPFGRGEASIIDARAMTASGLFITLGGVVFLVGLLASVRFLPPNADWVPFAIVFGLAAGLPLSEIVYFAQVTRIERTSGGRIYSVTEETEEDGRTVLRKTLELTPAS